ncbi:hypothetical protein JIN80_17515, partial [Cerasicoccus arenae]
MRLCQENSLTLCATHEPSDIIRKEPEKSCQRLKGLGCKYTAYSSPVGVDFFNEESVKELIADLKNAVEFLRSGEATMLDRIYNETPIQAELDTYGVAAGGCDPERWVHKVAGRTPLIHLKDFKMIKAKEHIFFAIGHQQGADGATPGIVVTAQSRLSRWLITG